MHAPTQLTFCEQGEPPFHEIQPRGAGWGEVQMEPGSFQQPAMDQGRLMRAVVIQNHVDIQPSGHAGLNRVEELAEFAGSMPLVKLANDVARPHLQRNEQRGGLAQARFPMSGSMACCDFQRQN